MVTFFYIPHTIVVIECVLVTGEAACLRHRRLLRYRSRSSRHPAYESARRFLLVLALEWPRPARLSLGLVASRSDLWLQLFRLSRS